MKNCTKCKKEKSLESFNKDKSRTDGREFVCKSCKKEQRKSSLDKKDLSKEKECGKCNQVKQLKDFYKGRWHECKECCKSRRNANYKANPEIQKKRSAEYREKNREECNQSVREWRKNNKEYVSYFNKMRWEVNKEELKKKNREYYKKNKEKIKEASKKYRENNKEILREKSRKYLAYRRKNDHLYRVKKNLRCRTRLAFKGSKWTKRSSCEELLGCKYNVFLNHIESQFQEGMTWENHGYYGWHIDHIIPLASATTEEELIKLCHYTNLQPLWAEDNMKKRDKIIE